MNRTISKGGTKKMEKKKKKWKKKKVKLIVQNTSEMQALTPRGYRIPGVLKKKNKEEKKGCWDESLRHSVLKSEL